MTQLGALRKFPGTNDFIQTMHVLWMGMHLKGHPNVRTKPQQINNFGGSGLRKTAHGSK